MDVFAKILRTSLKKFLDNRSKRLANTIEIYFDKRSFQKLEKNLKKFICIRQIDKSILAKKNLRPRFFLLKFFFFTNLLKTFGNYYVKLPPSEWLVFFHIFISLGSVRNTL